MSALSNYLHTNENKHEVPDLRLPQRETFPEEPRPQSRYRNVVFTVNNWTQEEWDFIWGNDAFSYLVMGREVGRSGTPHIQGYGEFRLQRRFNNVKEVLGQRAWFQARHGTSKQAADYCKEDGDYAERGRISTPGAAAVLNDLASQIEDGVHVDTITREQPVVFHQYGRTLNRLQTLHHRGMRRTWMTQGIWYYGPTGTGKSYTALKDYDVKTHYIWPNDGMWCDGYRGQEIVVINDYRGTMAELQYQDLLNMVDWTPYFVRRRGEEPLPFLAKTVIVTSSMSPTQLWQGKVGGMDSIDQLLRRFQVIHMAVPFRHGVSESSGVILSPETEEIKAAPSEYHLRPSDEQINRSFEAIIVRDREAEEKRWLENAERNINEYKQREEQRRRVLFPEPPVPVRQTLEQLHRSLPPPQRYFNSPLPLPRPARTLEEMSDEARRNGIAHPNRRIQGMPTLEDITGERPRNA